MEITVRRKSTYLGMSLRFIGVQFRVYYGEMKTKNDHRNDNKNGHLKITTSKNYERNGDENDNVQKRLRKL